MPRGLLVGQGADQRREKVQGLRAEEIHRTGHFEEGQRGSREAPPDNLAAESIGDGLLPGCRLQRAIVDGERVPQPLFESGSFRHEWNLSAKLFPINRDVVS